ncbi:vWA domain-containing protein [Paenibacillus flagellatus]|uniref:VWFA domain-containing protein n=1 Tax=Paenibacillus flagellatus TaxID=2211139 RepID=A0A2V5JXZ6_9BACL|nr:BatA and WFA domain-containing protein [Paenibacillus flagellatus]PYI51729.1 hypothetical protein DLM86_22660 [Paenibacillus flagellatus]
MHFDSAAALWFGLSLPAIVLLYLFKRNYIDTPVSSHLLWNRVLKELEANRPWQKLRSRLLMIVQLLVAAMLVLALMQPWVWSERKAKGHAVVVLDRSASMTAAAPAAEGGEPESRLERAKRLVTDWIESDASESAVTVIAMGGQADVLLTRETDIGTLRETIAGVEPSYGKTAYKEAMSLAAALTRGDADAEIRVFTDGQFAEPATGLSFDVPVTVVSTEEAGKAAPGNVSVAQFGVKRAPTSESGETAVTAVATIKNWGDAPAAVELSLYAGGSLAEVRKATVDPGKTASVYFERLVAADWYKLDAGGADAMRADDVSYAFLEGDRPKKVLSVGTGNLFLEKALQLAGAEVTKLAPDDAQAWIDTARDGNGPDAIAIDAVDASVLASESWQKLLASKPVLYVQSGFEGTEVPVPAGAITVGDHPATRYLKFRDTHVASALLPKSLSWGKPIVSAQNVPLVYAGEENGLPRIALAFALQRTDWPLRPEFPVFVQNALEWLTSAQGGSLGRAVAGERKEIAVSPRAASAEWVAEDGGAAAGTEIETSSGRPSPVQPVPAIPGLYRLVEKDEAGHTVQTRWLGVMPDPGESGRAAAPLSFGPDASNGGETNGTGAADLTDSTAERGAPYALWRWLAVLALAFVVWEWGVYRRGASV